MVSVPDPAASRFGAPPTAGLRRLAGDYDVLLCDLWGVMHDGRHVFAPAVEALTRFRQGGGTVIFITNAPRPREPVLDQLAGLGLPAEAFDGIVTSGDVTVAAIATQGRRPLYHIGPPRDLALFESVRQRTGIEPRLTDLATAEVIVVTGLFDDGTETVADYAERLAAMRARDLPLICANPDIVVHVGQRLIYCGGALAQAYAALGGRTILAGKPHPPIYAAAMALAAERRGAVVARGRTLAIGDGLVTDGAGAADQGLDFLLVTSGIHRDEFHPDPDAPLDPGPYAARLAAVSPSPLAAMRHLCW